MACAGWFCYAIPSLDHPRCLHPVWSFSQARHLPFMVSILAPPVRAPKLMDLPSAKLSSTEHVPSKVISLLLFILSPHSPHSEWTEYTLGDWEMGPSSLRGGGGVLITWIVQCSDPLGHVKLYF